MIDVILADQHELFQSGMAELLGDAGDIYVMAQPRSAEPLLSVLGTLIPHVLLLSTNFLPVFPKIERLLQRRTALLLLAEDNDSTDYVQRLPAQGVIYRSIDGPHLIGALRGVARGELFVQGRSSNVPNELPARNAETRIVPEACG